VRNWNNSASSACSLGFLAVCVNRVKRCRPIGHAGWRRGSPQFLPCSSHHAGAAHPRLGSSWSAPPTAGCSAQRCLQANTCWGCILNHSDQHTKTAGSCSWTAHVWHGPADADISGAALDQLALLRHGPRPQMVPAGCSGPPSCRRCVAESRPCANVSSSRRQRGHGV
jgi:hypothetical protein